MMRSFLLKYSGKAQGFIIIAATITFAYIIALIFQQFFDLHQLKANTDLISAVYQVMGTIYAILLTFTLWGVWQNYTAADAAVQKETYALLDLVHMVEACPNWQKFNIRQAALNYAKHVIGEEWVTLRDITSCLINNREHIYSSSNEIVQAMQSINPADEREMTIYSHALTLLNNWLDARRARTLIARGNCAKALWPVLFTGAFVLFAFHGFFVAQTPGIWVMLLGGASLVIGLTFYLIFTLDCPFGGYPCIDSEPFRLAIGLLNQGLPRCDDIK